jgi:hypothetical protein
MPRYIDELKEGKREIEAVLEDGNVLDEDLKEFFRLLAVNITAVEIRSVYMANSLKVSSPILDLTKHVFE